MDYQKLMDDLAPVAVSYGVRAVGVLVLLFVAWLIAGWAARLVLAGMQKARIDLTLSRFGSRLARWSVLLLALLACLSLFGIETTSFAAVIGAAGLAIGLAFQGTLSNFAAGVMLLVFRTFKVGDVINAAGQTGKVYEIELFTTAIDTFDNRRIIIPNSSIFGSVIENVSHHPTRRVDLTVGVDYAADIDHTREVLGKAILQVEGALEKPAAAVALTGLGDSSVEWTVRVWCNSSDYGGVKEATLRSLKLSLDEANIGIPYPTMDVHLNSPQAQRDDD